MRAGEWENPGKGAWPDLKLRVLRIISIATWPQGACMLARHREKRTLKSTNGQISPPVCAFQCHFEGLFKSYFFNRQLLVFLAELEVIVAGIQVAAFDQKFIIGGYMGYPAHFPALEVIQPNAELGIQ